MMIDSFFIQHELSEREQEIAKRLLRTDMNVVSIAQHFKLSPTTVYKIANDIYRKVGASNRFWFHIQYSKFLEDHIYQNNTGLQ